jgi:hypothetical protein
MIAKLSHIKKCNCQEHNVPTFINTLLMGRLNQTDQLGRDIKEVLLAFWHFIHVRGKGRRSYVDNQSESVRNNDVAQSEVGGESCNTHSYTGELSGMLQCKIAALPQPNPCMNWK